MFTSKLSLLAFALLSLSSQSFAGTTSGNLQTTATLNSSCSVFALGINFGTITPSTSGIVEALGSIHTTCSKGVAYVVRLSTGAGSFEERTMIGTSGNTDTLAYNLYTNASRDTIWSNPANGGAVELVGTGLPESNFIFAALPLNQYIKPDNYSDNITVNLSY